MRLQRTLVLLTATMILVTPFAGCGGGSSGSGSASAPSGYNDETGGQIEKELSGVGAKGIFQYGAVTIDEIKDNGEKGDEPLFQTTTNAYGEYEATISAYTGKAMVSISGPYSDEASGTLLLIDESEPLRAVVGDIENRENIAVTPLTEVATRIAEDDGLTKTAIEGANERVSNIFDFDILGVQPLDLFNSDLSAASVDQLAYSFILAAISQWSYAADLSYADVIAMLQNDIAGNNDTLETGNALFEGFLGFYKNNESLQDNVSPSIWGSIIDLRLGYTGEVFSFPDGLSGLYLSQENRLFRFLPSVPAPASADGTWDPLPETQLPIRALFLSPKDPEHVFAELYRGNAEAVSSLWQLQSDDEGNYQWIDMGIDGIVRALAISPADADTLYASFGSGIVQKSTDRGETWTAANSGIPESATVNTISIDPSNTAILYAGAYCPSPGDGTAGGVYKSENGGTGWRAINAGLVFDDGTGNTYLPSVISIAINPNNPNMVFIGTSQMGVFKSIDGGETWSSVNIGIEDGEPYQSKVLFDPQAAGTVYMTHSVGLLKSIDNGAHWTSLLFGTCVQGLSLSATQSPSALYVSSYPGEHGIIESLDGGKSWAVFQGVSLEQEI